MLSNALSKWGSDLFVTLAIFVQKLSALLENSWHQMIFNLLRNNIFFRPGGEGFMKFSTSHHLIFVKTYKGRCWFQFKINRVIFNQWRTFSYLLNFKDKGNYSPLVSKIKRNMLHLMLNTIVLTSKFANILNNVLVSSNHYFFVNW